MQKQQDMSRYIKGGDLVRLRHTELEGYLTADYCYEDKQSKQPEVYVRKYYGQYEEEKLQTDSLWEVEINDFSQRGNMCIIDLDDQNASRSLKLRHFATGRLLMLNIAKQIPVLGPHIEE